jgi:hypothetical protein
MFFAIISFMICSNSAYKFKHSLGQLGMLDSAVGSTSNPTDLAVSDSLCGIDDIFSANQSLLIPPEEVQLIVSVTFNSTGTVGDLNNASLSNACQSLGKIVGEKKMAYLDSDNLEDFLFGTNFTKECHQCEEPAPKFTNIADVAQIPVPICIASRPCGENNESGNSTFAVHFTSPGIPIYGPFHLIELAYSTGGDLLFIDTDLPPLFGNNIASLIDDNDMHLWVKGSASIPFKIDSLEILQLDNVVFGAGVSSQLSPSENLLNLFQFGLDISQWQMSDEISNLHFQLNGMIEPNHLNTDPSQLNMDLSQLHMDFKSILNFSVTIDSATRIFW